MYPYRHHVPLQGPRGPPIRTRSAFRTVFYCKKTSLVQILGPKDLQMGSQLLHYPQLGTSSTRSPPDQQLLRQRASGHGLRRASEQTHPALKLNAVNHECCEPSIPGFAGSYNSLLPHSCSKVTAARAGVQDRGLLF